MSEKHTHTMTETELIIWASGTFLTENLPDNYDIWTDDQFNNFLEDFAWQPFEEWKACDIYRAIEDLATDAGLTFFKKEAGETT